MLIDVRDAVFGYGEREIIRVDALELRAGHSLGIFGPNGAGKTTLVRGLSGLLKPLRGLVERSPDLRIGYLPQYRAIDLNWPMSGLDAALLAISARRRFGWVSGQSRRARAMMERLGVSHLAPKRFATLSGGQQQRILLAGAMASEPQVLILDEPTDGLDVHSRENLLALLKEFASSGLAVVMISHEIEDLTFLCDTVARLHPADDPEHPAHVEAVTPTMLALQVTGVSS
jgi:manganese/iron transport system ATP-binding protein